MKTLNELLQVLESCTHLEFDGNIERLSSQVAQKIVVDNVCERFGVKPPKSSYCSPAHIPLDYDGSQGIYLWGKDSSISWPDNGQPKAGEYLYILRFTTGAYSLHSEYPAETFKAMFSELMAFEPKYSDSRNNYLYFDESKSKAVFEAYPAILKKYKQSALDEIKQKKIDKIKAELEKLEAKQ
jgi:hypothetical protein